MKYHILKSFRLSGCLFILMLTIPFLAYSQSVWVYETETEATIGLEAMIPSLEGDGADSPTGVLVIYSHIPLSNTYSLQVDVPIARFGDFDSGAGNPYLGVEYANRDINFTADLGVRLPVSELDGASVIGILANPYNIGAFAPNVTTVPLNIDYRYVASSGLVIRIGGGPQLFFPEEGESEMFLKYYGQVLYDTDTFTFGGGLLGRAVITEDNESIDERTIHSFGILGSCDFGTLNAGAYLRLPLNDTINDALSHVVGLNVSVGF